MAMSDDKDEQTQGSMILPWSSIDPDDEFPDEPAEDLRPSGGGWTLFVLCVGLGLIAACIIIPQADANRRLAYEHQRLFLDLQQIQKQMGVNKDFLSKIETDPQLAERVARRQMNVVPQGETALQLTTSAQPQANASRMSPFMIVKVPPPPPLAPYKPVGGILSQLCRQPQSQLYVLGIGMVLVAAGLVLGDKSSSPQSMNCID
jgi:hypothetical protein